MLYTLASLSAASLLGLASLLGPVVNTLTDTVDAAVAVIDDGVFDSGAALVHVAAEADLDAVADAAAAEGLTVTSRYHAIDVFHATGTAAQLAALADDAAVTRLEYDAPVSLFTNTSHTATRGKELLDGEVTVGGVIVDGAGVGVAVVDTGVAGLHPDLTSRLGANVKVLPGGVAIPLPDTDTTSLGGHGTHVAGIVAGDGTASNGRFHGAATGATIHGVSAGTLVSLHSALDGLNWVLRNHDRVSPAIRVVNNSWGSAAADHNPNNAIARMVGALIDQGIVVVFAAGNDGGDGSTQRTSQQCVDPTPGVICVAAYDDLNSGTRDGRTASFSSRGAAGSPHTYPDLAAPGASITAACQPTMPICLLGLSGPDPINYATLSGTSMAAPHIAGIAAQMLQVNPALTPAEVESILVSTATSYGDQPWAEGAGLVDAVAAVLAAANR